VSSAIEAHLRQCEVAARKVTEERHLGGAQGAGRHLPSIRRKFAPHLVVQRRALRGIERRDRGRRHRLLDAGQPFEQGMARVAARATRGVQAGIDVADGRIQHIGERGGDIPCRPKGGQPHQHTLEMLRQRRDARRRRGVV
jgi:hypothetical protein